MEETTHNATTIDLAQATKITLDEMSSLGPAFAPMAESFRSMTQAVAEAENVAGEATVHATSKSGKSLDLSVLQDLKEAKGTIDDARGKLKDAKKGVKGAADGLSSLRDAARKVAHGDAAQLQAVTDQAQAIAPAIPYDPTTLLVAAALAETNRKLDAIQETQQAMFSYMREHDKAELRGSLETLADVLDNYRYNVDDEKYRTSKHMLVQSIRNDAQKAIVFHQGQLEQALKGKGGTKLSLRTDKDVRKKVDTVRDELEEYRLGVYLYAYASFLEVMLLQNFKSDYLDSMAGKIETYANTYRELYTSAYNTLEREADSSVRAFALGGLSSALGHLGNVVEKTPVGATKLDERLSGAGKGVGKINENVKGGMLNKLVDACKSDVQPFVDSIERVSVLYNDPSMLLLSDDAVFVVPQ